MHYLEMINEMYARRYKFRIIEEELMLFETIYRSRVQFNNVMVMMLM